MFSPVVLVFKAKGTVTLCWVWRPLWTKVVVFLTSSLSATVIIKLVRHTLSTFWQEAHLSLLLPRRPLTVFDFVADLAAERTGAGLVGLELLSDDGEVGLVGGQAQHDEIGCSVGGKLGQMTTLFPVTSVGVQSETWRLTVGSTQAVVRVGVVVRLSCRRESQTRITLTVRSRPNIYWSWQHF